MHACSRSNAVAKKGFEPPFWGDLGLFWPSEKAHIPTRSTLAVFQDSICAVVSPPRAIHTSEKNTSDKKQLDSGGWGCRMTRLFSHETGLFASRPLQPRKMSAAQAETGVLCNPPPL